MLDMNDVIMEYECITMPAMALRGVTVFPNMTLHFEVERESSLNALEKAMENGKRIFLVTQRDISVEQVSEDDLYDVGTISAVKQVLHLPGGYARVMVEGIERGRLQSVVQLTPCIMAKVKPVLEESVIQLGATETEALLRVTYDLFQEYVEISGKVSNDIIVNVIANRDISWISDYIAQNIPLRYEDKQIVLEEFDAETRLILVNQILSQEIQILHIDQDIQKKVQKRANDAQKDYYLREQIKVIQEELGDDSADEFKEYAEKIDALALPGEISEKLHKELKRLQKQPFGSSEASVLRNYLDVCLEIPWGVRTDERVDVLHARKILDADHFGMEKVKERILEFLAVKQLSPDLKGQIICLVGPPGVGKTSIASSVAKALNRKMSRLSLGGVRDEAEIRGHRKTYVGAMPGRIIDAVVNAGSCNPLILLDEIDKLGSDYRGDPSAALLEVLDAEQNATFRDHFLEFPFDLSDVMFITTCNTLDTVPKPLLDRMEVIELPSYTDEEKFQIAKKHLLAKEMMRHGLNGNQIRIQDSAFRKMIVGYTRESGLRQLERVIASICRKAAMKIAVGEAKRVTVTEQSIESLIGPQKYHPDTICVDGRVGVVNGLAWTSVGGEILEVEVSVMPGTGKIISTGNLGDVMKESVQAAVSYIRSNATLLGIDSEFYQKQDLHIHFPEGAVPKDGPSAGITITTAIVSALSGREVKPSIAMTGEVSIRGRVLPIGGLREKTMAAYRNGIRTVIIPKENNKDLAEIDPTVYAAINFIPVSHVSEVLAEALKPVVHTHDDTKTIAPDVIATASVRTGSRSNLAQ